MPERIPNGDRYKEGQDIKYDLFKSDRNVVIKANVGEISAEKIVCNIYEKTGEQYLKIKVAGENTLRGEIIKMPVQVEKDNGKIEAILIGNELEVTLQRVSSSKPEIPRRKISSYEYKELKPKDTLDVETYRSDQFFIVDADVHIVDPKDLNVNIYKDDEGKYSVAIEVDLNGEHLIAEKGLPEDTDVINPPIMRMKNGQLEVIFKRLGKDDPKVDIIPE